MKRLSTFLPRILLGLLLTVTILVTPSCTHNGGDLGGLFGTWHLDRITIDGQPDTAYDGTIIWKFQFDVVAMMPTDDAEHQRFEGWGTWSFAPGDRNVLLLHYIHYDDKREPGDPFYSPLPATHLPAGELALDIDHLGSSGMQLTYHDPTTATVYTYYFTKW